MPISKSTKKFEKNHLKDVIKKRKEIAKIKQKQQMKAKAKERKAKDNEPAAGLEENGTINKAKSQSFGKSTFGEMSMDEFFQGGFQVPELPKKKGGKPSTGKRKRTPIEEDTASGSEDEPESAGEQSGSESGSEDDTEAHKAQLEELVTKDPEFYKYLQDNDAELLDFAEDADLAELDALSADEQDEETPRKKRKKGKEETLGKSNEVTKSLVKKWGSSMESAHSLRATKEVVLAFRAAAHLNEDDGKDYKYSISNPDGKDPLFPIHKRSQMLIFCSIS
jgi:nucleolar complex protein 2